ncbi:MAG: M14 family metallopeptidase [Pseudomonadota bacterium]
MKKFIKPGIISLAVLTGIGIGYVTYLFNAYKPNPIAFTPVATDEEYFGSSYQECRNQFRTEADTIFNLIKGVTVSWVTVDSQIDSDLTIDYCYIPAQKNFKRLLILTSGIHGVEGYAGSAVQQMFLHEIVPKIDLEEMGILVIHSINPYGFKYQRRVTENNIDLNRNCNAGPEGFESQNKGYDALNFWLNQKKPLLLTEIHHFFFPLYAIQKVFKYSLKTMRQSILQGQYQHEKGIFFGGKTREPAVQLLTPLVQEIAEGYEMVFSIDLHTGYGANGTLHLFSEPLKDAPKRAKIETIFKGFHLDWGDTDDFYTVSGDFLFYQGQVLRPKEYLPIVFEFGTLDTQTILGAMKALHNLMIENQGVHYGYATNKDETAAKNRFMEGYCPASAAWRSKAIHDARILLQHAVKNYQKVDAVQQN